MWTSLYIICAHKYGYQHTWAMLAIFLMVGALPSIRYMCFESKMKKKVKKLRSTKLKEEKAQAKRRESLVNDFQTYIDKYSQN